jgi:probable phosphoglycerate mutase
MKVWVMRHGQTNYNLLGLCSDDPDAPVHLTPIGEAQAERAARQLRRRRLDRIFASRLPRTQQTAAIVNRYHEAPVEVRSELDDIRTGFDGRSVSEYFAATGHDRLHARVEGGESLLDYKERVMGFLRWLPEQPLDEVLVVAHEETLRVIVAHFRGLEDSDMDGLHFDNADVLEFDL